MSPPISPLDPDARACLELVAKLNLPGWETMPPAEARNLALEIAAKAPIPHVTVGSTRVRNIQTRHGPVAVHEFRPPSSVAQSPGPLAALVYFHGGGWVLGHSKAHEFICRTLSRTTGITVFSVDYPLAPEAPFPAPLEASADIWRWIVENASSLELDPARIGIGGDSAGGNLSAVISLLARDGELPKPKVQCLLYPVTDLSMSQPSWDIDPDKLFLKPVLMEWFVDQYIEREDRGNWLAAPLLASSLKGVAPAYVMTAGYDILADEGRDYAARLRDEGVPVTEKHWPGQIHNFLALPHMVPTAFAGIADLSEFLLVGLCEISGA